MAVKGTAGERKSAILLKKYELNREDKTIKPGIWKRLRVNKTDGLLQFKSIRKYDRIKRNDQPKEFASIEKEPIYFWEIA
ncbi:MAG TPA: hypothetical protein VGN20_00050 [Mucilaginibacter sp.]|jgi:hypothetical protein